VGTTTRKSILEITPMMTTPLPRRSTAARRTALALLLGCGLLLTAASCQQILGTGDFQDLCKPYGLGDPPNCSPNQQAAAVCTPNEVRECPYSGDPKTKGVGACRAAKQTCNADGTALSGCEGEVLPKKEDCTTPADDNCNGTANEPEAGCTKCMPGTMMSCYDGPTGTEGVGICKAGTWTCVADGTHYGNCDNEVVPQKPSCAATDDVTCDKHSCVLWDEALGQAGTVSTAAIAQLAPSPDGSTIALINFPAGASPVAFGKMVLTGPGAFVVKFGPDGEGIWSAQMDTGVFTAVATDATNNVAVAGEAGSAAMFKGTAVPVSQFVAKLDSNGGLTWVKSFGGFHAMASFSGSGGPTSIAIESGGEISVAGVFKDNLTLDDGSLAPPDAAGSAYVARFGADGANSASPTGTHWAHAFSAFKRGFRWLGPFVGVDALHNTQAVFNFTGAANLGGMTSYGGADIGIATISQNGSINAAHFGDTQDQLALSANVGADGSLAVAGSYLGTLTVVQPSITAVSTQGFGNANTIWGDGFALVLNAGSFTARLLVGTGTAAHLTGIGLAGDGSIGIAGDFTGMATLSGAPIDGGAGTSLLVAKFKGDASFDWAKSILHGKDDALAASLQFALADDGTSVLGGQASVTPLDFGTGSLSTAANPNISFLARFAP
jgi:hypothetical protein